MYFQKRLIVPTTIRFGVMNYILKNAKENITWQNRKKMNQFMYLYDLKMLANNKTGW